MNYFVDHLYQIAIPVGKADKMFIDELLSWWSDILKFEPPNNPLEINRLPTDFTLEECHTIVNALNLADALTSLIENAWYEELTLIAVLYFYKQGGEWGDRFDILPQEKVDELGYIILK